MLGFYKLSVIPKLLNNFKVEKAIISGLQDEKLVNEVLAYDAEFTAIDANESHPSIATINDYPLNALALQGNYDAIFINDDPNWYTLYNELNIIKNTNEEFPLVFICNSRFPNKRRDSYSNPEIIPQEYRQKYVKNLPICYNNKKIIIEDGYYHACNEKTPKNGVLTAIEDFIGENPTIGIMDMNFIEEIIILYPKNTISSIRINKTESEIEDDRIEYDGLSDKLVENQLLVNYIEKHDLANIDETVIGTYKNKIQLQDSELKYKDSQIVGINSELSVKDLQIKNIESKLVNKENEINNLKSQLETSNDKLSELKNLDSEMKSTKELLNTIQKNNTYKTNQLTSKEYCISCFKEEISNNKVEIEYLKNTSLIKKILSPLSYIYLILKSNPKELGINFKLYKALNNSKCFNIGYYLNNNPDIQESRWIKLFSPELHYVCNGFDEDREFNKKYFNRHSKEELLDYLLTCEKKS